MSFEVEGFQLQADPQVYVAKIPGKWLLEHVTPSWRIKDPIQGFQRIVNEKRAIQIAKTVLDQERSFPNAIVLASDMKKLTTNAGQLVLPKKSLFLVVDGQHRLWAQNFSDFEAPYTCVLHLGLDEQEMAKLFVEINDNQKRVPSSLRWDLVRLVREQDQAQVRAADIVYELHTSETSALFQRIDLTGEVKELKIKQGSLAPEIESAVKKAPLKGVGYDVQVQVFLNFFTALKDCDPEGWDASTSNLYSNRIIRALIRTIAGILEAEDITPSATTPATFYNYLSHIDLDSLDPEAIRGQQGSAGMSAIYDTISAQMFD